MRRTKKILTLFLVLISVALLLSPTASALNWNGTAVVGVLTIAIDYIIIENDIPAGSEGQQNLLHNSQRAIGRYGQVLQVTCR